MFPSDRFAAFLAHSLNSYQAPTCTVEPGYLYVLLLDALAAKYKESLLYHSSYRFRMSEEEAATAYFTATLERALWLSNKVEMSVAHVALLAMCRRGIGAVWRNTELRRQTLEPNKEPAVASLLAVGSFDAVAGRLQKLSFAISAGNPALTIRQRKGSLWLMVGQSGVQVPEEISVWNAIIYGPTVVQSLAAGEPFNRFCGTVIDAVRTANRPIQELLGLGRGICPFDWIDVLSTNQVRGLRRFLNEVALLGEPDTQVLWSRAWAKTPVPGFRNAEELWTSEIGRALRLSTGNLPPVPIDLIEDQDDTRPDILEPLEFQQQLALLKTQGVICAIEQSILVRLYSGEKLDDVAADKSVQSVLRERGVKFTQFIADLHNRIANWQVPQGALHG